MGFFHVFATQRVALARQGDVSVVLEERQGSSSLLSGFKSSRDDFKSPVTDVLQ